MGRSVPLASRFFRYAIPGESEDDCWSWMGALDRGGYGRISAGRAGAGVLIASRVSYELHVGPIPPGMNALHSCDEPSCCNPRHLFLGTHADNVADKMAKGRHRGNTGESLHAGRRAKPECMPRGEQNYLAKLTDEAVRAMRTEYAAGTTTMAKLAARYGVAESTVSKVINRKGWAHVT